MEEDKIERKIRDFIQPFAEKGYTALSGNLDDKTVSLNGQLRNYLHACYDQAAGEGKEVFTSPRPFQLTTHHQEQMTVTMYVFHCTDDRQDLKCRSLEVSVDSKKMSIPVIDTIPSVDLVTDLYRLKFPEQHSRNVKRAILPGENRANKKL